MPFEPVSVNVKSIHINRMVQPINISFHDFHLIVLIPSFSLLLIFAVLNKKRKTAL